MTGAIYIFFLCVRLSHSHLFRDRDKIALPYWISRTGTLSYSASIIHVPPGHQFSRCCCKILKPGRVFSCVIMDDSCASLNLHKNFRPWLRDFFTKGRTHRRIKKRTFRPISNNIFAHHHLCALLFNWNETPFQVIRFWYTKSEKTNKSKMFERRCEVERRFVETANETSS